MTSVSTSARQAAFFLQGKVTAWPWPALRHVTTHSPITLSLASAFSHSPRSQVEIQAFILKREKKQRRTLVSARMAPKHSARVLPFAFFPAGSELVTSCVQQCSSSRAPAHSRGLVWDILRSHWRPCAVQNVFRPSHSFPWGEGKQSHGLDRKTWRCRHIWKMMLCFESQLTSHFPVYMLLQMVPSPRPRARCCPHSCGS